MYAPVYFFFSYDFEIRSELQIAGDFLHGRYYDFVYLYADLPASVPNGWQQHKDRSCNIIKLTFSFWYAHKKFVHALIPTN